MLLEVNLTIEGVEGKCQFEVGCTIYMMVTGGGYEATERPDLICQEEESEGGFQEQTLTSRASHLETTDQCGKCPDRGQGGATCTLPVVPSLGTWPGTQHHPGSEEPPQATLAPSAGPGAKYRPAPSLVDVFVVLRGCTAKLSRGEPAIMTDGDWFMRCLYCHRQGHVEYANY